MDYSIFLQPANFFGFARVSKWEILSETESLEILFAHLNFGIIIELRVKIAEVFPVIFLKIVQNQI
jgi:hypothetical protein